MEPFINLTQGKRIVIPLYQRGFAWREENVGAVMFDLRLARELDLDHFFGSVVWEPIPNDGGPVVRDQGIKLEEVELQDGQQRVVTFFLFFAALRKRISTLLTGVETRLQAVGRGTGRSRRLEGLRRALQSELESLDKVLFIKPNGSSADPEPRLRYRDESLAEAFRFAVGIRQQRPVASSGPVRRLLNAAATTQRISSNFSAGTCRTWRQTFSHRSLFHLIDLDTSRIHPQIAFEGINARGITLSQFDKIKNLSMLAQERANHELGLAVEAPAERLWLESIQALDRRGLGEPKNEDDFIREAYAVFHGDARNQPDAHAKFRNRYMPVVRDTHGHSVRAEELNTFVALWLKYAESYAYYSSNSREPTAKYADGTQITNRDALAWLDRLRNMDYEGVARPLLVASLVRFGGQSQDFLAVARACEIYTFRVHALMGRQVDKNRKKMLLLAHDVLAKGASRSTVIEGLRGLVEADASDQMVRNELGNGAAKYPYDKDVRGWGHTYYFLFEYEVHLAGASGAAHSRSFEEVNKRKTSIEHVLPQSYANVPEWTAVWADEAEAKAYLHRLGNLVITDGNSVLRNKPFAKKLDEPPPKYCYKRGTHSEQKLNEYAQSDVSGQPIWTPESIRKREEVLIGFAVDGRWMI